MQKIITFSLFFLCISSNFNSFASQTENIFDKESKYLKDAVEKLKKSIDSKVQKKEEQDSTYGVVINSMNPFWTATAIGSQTAAKELSVKSTFKGSTKDANINEQKLFINRHLQDNYKGLIISPIDSEMLKETLQKAKNQKVPVIVMDSDVDSDLRKVYLGTNNYEAGLRAGRELVKVLGKEGGKVIGTVGVPTALNSKERIRGIKDAIKGTKVTLKTVLTDNIDMIKAKEQPRAAIKAHPDMKAFVTIYAYNGPFAAEAVIEAGKVGKIKIVAFDTDRRTMHHLEKGVISSAIGQRPYFWGYLGVYALQAFNLLGDEKTYEILTPYFSDKKNKILDTGVDVITSETLKQYYEHLASLNIKSQ